MYGVSYMVEFSLSRSQEFMHCLHRVADESQGLTGTHHRQVTYTNYYIQYTASTSRRHVQYVQSKIHKGVSGCIGCMVSPLADIYVGSVDKRPYVYICAVQ